MPDKMLLPQKQYGVIKEDKCREGCLVSKDRCADLPEEWKDWETIPVIVSRSYPFVSYQLSNIHEYIASFYQSCEG